jgi:hypothetical protein
MSGFVYEMSSVRKGTPLSHRMRGLDWRVFNPCEETNPFRNAIWLNSTQLDGCRFGFVLGCVWISAICHWDGE